MSRSEEPIAETPKATNEAVQGGDTTPVVAPVIAMNKETDEPPPPPWLVDSFKAVENSSASKEEPAVPALKVCNLKSTSSSSAHEEEDDVWEHLGLEWSQADLERMARAQEAEQKKREAEERLSKKKRNAEVVIPERFRFPKGSSSKD